MNRLPLTLGFLWTLVLACSSPRLYYVRSELPSVAGQPDLAIAPGPWKQEDVPVVVSDMASVPDELVLSALQALMALPGATDACDAHSGHPRVDAAEYCVAIYRTPRDWRVSWPVRELVGERSTCRPPFGGVEDADFGRDLPVFGFAHNHPCGSRPSSSDLVTFPAMRTAENLWVMVAYAASPSGQLARDVRGQFIPAWAWLATGHRDEPRFYKWNPSGEVLRWSESARRWEFQTTCQPQTSGMFGTRALWPRCSPDLDW